MFSHHFPQSLVPSLLCLNSHVLLDVIRIAFWWDNWRHCRSANNSLPFQPIFSPSEFQALVSFSSAKRQNPTAKCIKFWFCVTFSALFFNRQHFRSGNDNLTFLSKLSLLYAFQANSRIGIFIVSEMTENPTAKYEKFWFWARLLINFGRASVVVSVALINLAVLQIMQVFRI